MSHSKDKRPLLGLALSGGAAWCIAQIGVLEVLEEAGITVDAIAGSSGGSLVGALYLDGKLSLPGMASLAARTGWRSMLRPTIPRTGLVSSAGIYRFIKSHLNSRYIGDLPKPFAAVCADLVTGEKVVLTHGELARAVQASCSIPIIFTPTEMHGRLLIDGGYASQIPVLAAKEELGARVVAAVDVTYKSPVEPELNSLTGIAMHLAQNYARKNALPELEYADAVISVDVGGIQSYDIGRHEELLDRGRKAAKRVVPEIKRLLADASS